MRKLFQIFILAIISLLPALASANSVEYVFDEAFFSGSYSPEYYVAADIHFNAIGNDFGAKIFFQDIKLIDTVEIELDNGPSKYCEKQVRGFYVNPVRGNRVRPLDEDSLNYLKTVDSSYDSLTMSGGLYVCSQPSNGVFGYIRHMRSGETYSLIAGLDYDFATNRYIDYYRSDGTFLFANNTSTGYLRDSYGGIAQIFGSGLNVEYLCGNGVEEDGESCDDGANNGLVRGGCNTTCNGLVTNICGNGNIETPETCDEGSGSNGQPSHCNLACNGTTPDPVHPGPPPSNICDSVDCAKQYSSLCCTIKDDREKFEKVLISTGLALPNSGTCSTIGSPYSAELTEAFSFAYSHNITSQCPITKANLHGTLIRKHAAKMISQFALTVLKKTPDNVQICEFTDMQNETPEMQYFARLACKLGLMGLKPDGTPDTKFNPNKEVTRAQFGTMVSRLLYGNQNNAQPGKWYEAHLNALKSAGIMTKISQPMILELRGYVMIMMERIAEK